MMRTLIVRICFGLAVLTAAVHLSTYAGFDPMTWWPGLWTMHALAMAALASTLVSGSVRLLPRGSNVLDLLDQRIEGDRGSAGATALANESDFARVVRPSRRKLMAGALGAYALINFVLCLSILRGGQPVRRAGEAVLESHGKVLATLSETQYRWQRAVQTRLATGHWLFAFYISGALWAAARTGRATSERRQT